MIQRQVRAVPVPERGEDPPCLSDSRNWLDSRTGYKHLVHEALEEPIPGGARWRYVFGSALTVDVPDPARDGPAADDVYSPSSSTAWGSVWYITYKMDGGWFIRGLHHFGSQAMVILLLLHMIQVVLAGAYRAPREVNWWFGLALMGVTLGFSLTGYLLPWDQKGYWATKVATKIASGAPGDRAGDREGRGRRRRLRQPDPHAVLRPARRRPAGPAGAVPRRRTSPSSASTA